MRRWILAVTLVLAVSGCSLPLGTDGDLGNQWPAFAEPTGWEPRPDTCHGSFQPAMTRDAYQPVECTAKHGYETVYIGQFTGEAAKLPSAPLAGTTDRQAAWAVCDAKVTEFVGAPWRSGKLWVSLATPSNGAWEGGARWFLCQVGALERINGKAGLVSASLKGELTRESPLKNRCYQVPANDNDETLEVACTVAHTYEFAGTFDPGMSWEDLQDYERTKAQVHTKCRSTIAGYVGVPDDRFLKYRTGTSVQYPDRDDWEAGDHHVRCHIFSDRTLTRSLKGTGNSGLPIR